MEMAKLANSNIMNKLIELEEISHGHFSELMNELSYACNAISTDMPDVHRPSTEAETPRGLSIEERLRDCVKSLNHYVLGIDLLISATKSTFGIETTTEMIERDDEEVQNLDNMSRLLNALNEISVKVSSLSIVFDSMNNALDGQGENKSRDEPSPTSGIIGYFEKVVNSIGNANTEMYNSLKRFRSIIGTNNQDVEKVVLKSCRA